MYTQKSGSSTFEEKYRIIKLNGVRDRCVFEAKKKKKNYVYTKTEANLQKQKKFALPLFLWRLSAFCVYIGHKNTCSLLKALTFLTQ